jgi:hypothetical protein
MWKLDAYRFAKVKYGYFRIEELPGGVKKRIIENGVEMHFSMDNKTLVLTEKEYTVAKLGVILFNAETFEKLGEYFVDRVDPTCKQILGYDDYYDIDYTDQYYCSNPFILLTTRVKSFDEGKFLLVSLSGGESMKTIYKYSVFDTCTGKVVNTIE